MPEKWFWSIFAGLLAYAIELRKEITAANMSWAGKVEKEEEFLRIEEEGKVVGRLQG